MTTLLHRFPLSAPTASIRFPGCIESFQKTWGKVANPAFFLAFGTNLSALDANGHLYNYNVKFNTWCKKTGDMNYGL